MESLELIKIVAGWVAVVGSVMTGAISYLFFQVVQLSKKVGALEEEVENYKQCPTPNCFFRPRPLYNPPTETITTNNPQAA